MTDEYKKMLLYNFDVFIVSDQHRIDVFGMMQSGHKKLCEQIWLEATRQADERNSIK